MGAKKKRRRAAREAAAEQVNEARKEAARAAQIQAEQYRGAEDIAGQFQLTRPGELSPYAKAQYGSDLERIIRTYRNLRESGMAAARQRGLGRSPSGLASIASTSARLQGEAETEAYRRALGATENEQWRLLGYRTGQQQFFDPTRRREATTGMAESSLRMNPASDPWGKIAQMISGGSAVGGMLLGVPGVGGGAPKPRPRAPVSSTIPLGSSGSGFP